MTSYIIRDIDPKLWKRLKVRAAQNEEPIRTVLIRAMVAYVTGKGLPHAEPRRDDDPRD
jgi:plasmid stability protein